MEKVVYSREESLEEYLARMDAQDARYRAYAMRQRLIRNIIKFAFIAAVLIGVFVFMAIR